MRGGAAAEGGSGREPASVTNLGISCVVCMAGCPSRFADGDRTLTAFNTDGWVGDLVLAFHIELNTLSAHIM